MDIAKIFTSKTRKELFRLYFTNPDREYYLRELERILGIPVSMVRKELLHLEQDGIFSSKKQGNLTYFYLNKDYPLFEELKSIVDKTIGVQGLLRKTLQTIEKIEIAFIYGSYAKREESAASDIDLFIIGDINEDALVTVIRKAEKILKREINYGLYARQDFQKKKQEGESFILELMKNPKIFLIGDEDAL